MDGAGKNGKKNILRWMVAICITPFIWLLSYPAIAQVELATEPLITGLSDPLDITHAGDGSGRLFIAERLGRVRIWDGASLLPIPFLDISNLTTGGGERGLLGLAFHPQYAVNGRFFVHYTDQQGDTVLAAYTVSPDANIADPASAAIVLQTLQPFPNHNGGQIRFGPDGFLYMALGDGGSGGDPQNNAQNLNSLLGKLLRIDVDGAVPYAIPADNPFVGQLNVREEIWAYGLRNPWRFSFDRLTGDLFIGDVGQNRFEEINFQPAASTGGENYGWRLMEGSSCFNPPADCNTAGDLVLPILEYGRATGFSVTGGFVYRGARIPELFGHYVFADFGTGTIFIAESQPGGLWNVVSTLSTPLRISAFGEDEDGEIYLAHLALSVGAVHTINLAAGSSPQPVPPPVGSPAPQVPTPTGASDGGGGGGGCFIRVLFGDLMLPN